MLLLHLILLIPHEVFEVAAGKKVSLSGSIGRVILILGVSASAWTGQRRGRRGHVRVPVH